MTTATPQNTDSEREADEFESKYPKLSDFYMERFEGWALVTIDKNENMEVYGPFDDKEQYEAKNNELEEKYGREYFLHKEACAIGIKFAKWKKQVIKGFRKTRKIAKEAKRKQEEDIESAPIYPYDPKEGSGGRRNSTITTTNTDMEATIPSNSTEGAEGRGAQGGIGVTHQGSTTGDAQVLEEHHVL